MDNVKPFNPVILREYDIRGQIGKNLGPDDAYALGLAFGTKAKSFAPHGKPAVIYVGYDGRLSSEELAESLTRGLYDTGAQVINIGRGPTPMLYYAAKSRDATGGIMITGSHNPPDYNGFKMMLGGGAVFGADIQELGHIVADKAFLPASTHMEPRNEEIDDDYVARLMQDLTAQKELKIVWDAGNGAAGDVLRKLTAVMPGNHILLYDEIDGTFPNHHPDPTVDENLEDLRKEMLENGADLGIAFDGDGDRIGVLDNQGNVLRCDILMTLYAKEILEISPGAPIIGDVKCSQVMFDEIDRMGGQGVMWKTGHSLIKAKMAELNAPLAGELSGHIFFNDKYYGFDDALYCAVRLMNIVGAADQTLAEMTQGISNLHSTPEIRFEVDEEEKFDLVPRIHSTLENNPLPDVKIDTIDGIRISTPDGWWLLRPSNTQNVLVARAEASTEDGLKRLTDMASNAVQSVGYELKFSA